MHILILAIAFLLSGILPARATVYEFGEDGSVLQHEAFDYRSARGQGQFEVFVAAILRSPPSFPRIKHGGNYEEVIQGAAFTYSLSPSLIRAVIKVESAGRHDAVSPKGAQGLMQLMPATARQYGAQNPFDPAQNIDAGSKYLKYLLNRYEQNTRLALAAYNAGEGTVDRYNGIPPYPETKNYVAKISNMLK